MPATRELTTSEHDWLRVRHYLREHRHELAVAAAEDFPAECRVAATPLLAARGWVPAAPIPLDAVDLEANGDVSFGDLSAIARLTALPTRPDGREYDRYSDVVGELAAPAVFEDRSTYRLLDLDLSGPRGRLVFGRGKYFDGIDVGEASAHEYAAKLLGEDAGQLRSWVHDPCAPSARPMNLAISTLTLRRDRDTGSTTFLLHWRDPAKVGHAGGLYQVIPVGVFQPSGQAAWNERNDFSLWWSMVREFAEELLGTSENYDSERKPIDYDNWEFARRITDEKRSDSIKAYCLGAGVDPLTFATDLLTVAVIDAPLFDELFGDVVAVNAEGEVLAAKPFDQDTVDQFVHNEPVQAAGAALLSLAWHHRAILLD
jgi:hypothetical protein